MTLLHPGDPFPHLRVERSDAPAIDLPDHLHGRFGVVLLFRGAWCPYCVAQLRAFGIGVVAMSVDDEATTARRGQCLFERRHRAVGALGRRRHGPISSRTRWLTPARPAGNSALVRGS